MLETTKHGTARRYRPGTSVVRHARPAPAALTVLAQLAALAVLTGVIGCGGQEEAGTTAGHGRGGRPAQRAVPVAVAAVGTGEIASYYRATATLEAEKQAEILARVSGVVETLLAEEGDVLTAGTPLLRIDNDEYRLRLTQAEAATANLRSRFERLEAMVSERLVTEEEYEAARSDLASAEAEEGLAALNLSYTTVRAPFTGGVTQRLVDVGSNLSVGVPLFVMADFDPLLARVHVPSKEFRKLRHDQTVELVLDSDGRRLAGRIVLIAPVIDPESGTIKVTVEVAEYPIGTRPGDFAEVRIVTELRPDAILVPREAVVTEKGETVVYVAVAGGRPGEGGRSGEGGRPGEGETTGPVAQRRVVEAGFTDDEHAEIVVGVELGERVVVKGQRSLEDGDPLTILAGPGAVAQPDTAEQRDGAAQLEANATRDMTATPDTAGRKGTRPHRGGGGKRAGR